MQIIKKLDPAQYSISISLDLRMTAVENRAWPPAHSEGLSVGIADMIRDPPHRGERHPDGDELIYILSGKVSITGDSAPDHPCELGPGDMCIVPKGEWHKVHLLQPTRLLHITPGPAREHRTL